MIRFLKRLLGGGQAPSPQIRPQRYLDNAMLMVSHSDALTIGDFCEGTAVFGGTGSGKSSGSGKAIAEAFMHAGFGGLVLTAKADERAVWQNFARQCGRENDLLIVSPDGPHRFNFLDYALQRPGVGAGLTGNIVSLFLQIMEVAEKEKGGKDDGFWKRTSKQLLTNAIDLLVLAKGSITLREVYDIIISAPSSPEQIQSEDWQKSSFCFACLAMAQEREHEMPEPRRLDLTLTGDYFLTEFPQLAEKTRSVVVSSLTSMMSGFLRHPLRELFCTDTTIVPEMAAQGKVFVLDLPVKEYEELGQFAQVLFKLLFQQTFERRQVEECTPPVFLWADEAHNFATESDILFQTTARSSRVCTVWLTQNRGNLEATYGGHNAKAQADAILGSLLLKIFHANDHVDQNTWAADTIGRTIQYRTNAGSSSSEGPEGGGGNNSMNAGVSEQMEHQVTPYVFTTLRTGGPANDLCVDAVLFKPGRIWNATQANYLPTTFSQASGP